MSDKPSILTGETMAAMPDGYSYPREIILAVAPHLWEYCQTHEGIEEEIRFYTPFPQLRWWTQALFVLPAGCFSLLLAIACTALWFQLLGPVCVYISSEEVCDTFGPMVMWIYGFMLWFVFICQYTHWMMVALHCPCTILLQNGCLHVRYRNFDGMGRRRKGYRWMTDSLAASLGKDEYFFDVRGIPLVCEYFRSLRKAYAFRWRNRPFLWGWNWFWRRRFCRWECGNSEIGKVIIVGAKAGSYILWSELAALRDTKTGVLTEQDAANAAISFPKPMDPELLRKAKRWQKITLWVGIIVYVLVWAMPAIVSYFMNGP